MSTHSSIHAWRIPWTEEPGELYSPLGRKELDMTETLTHTHTHTHTHTPCIHLGDLETKPFKGTPVASARVTLERWKAPSFPLEAEHPPASTSLSHCSKDILIFSKY